MNHEKLQLKAYKLQKHLDSAKNSKQLLENVMPILQEIEQARSLPVDIEDYNNLKFSSLKQAIHDLIIRLSNEDYILDKELLDMFVYEAMDLLNKIQTSMYSWKQNLSDFTFMKFILRDLHTLKGGAGMIEADNMINYIHGCEQFIEDLKLGAIAINKTVYDIFAKAVDALYLMIEHIKLGKKLPDASNIFNAMQSFHETIDEDDELLQIFTDEAVEIVNDTFTILLLLENDYSKQEHVNHIEGELHTLKGSARMVGQTIISELAHALEEVYCEILNGNILLNHDVFAVIYSGHEIISSMVELLRAKQPIVADDRILNRLRTLVNVDGFDVSSDPKLKKLFIEETTELIEDIKQNIAKFSSDVGNNFILEQIYSDIYTLISGAIVLNLPNIFQFTRQVQDFVKFLLQESTVVRSQVDTLGYSIKILQDMIAVLNNNDYIQVPDIIYKRLASEGEGKKVVISNQDEQIRVKSTVLEKLSNIAGEAGITNVHLKHQNHLINIFVDEASLSAKRLLVKLQNLQTISQSELKLEAVGREASDFDSLEMDRYTDLYSIVQNITELTHDLLSSCEQISATAQLSDDTLHQQSRLTGELQNNLLHARMISFSSIAPRMQRIVSHLSKELDKKIDFQLTHEEGEMDRTLLDKIVPIIEHIIRNSLDHGIENPLVRKKHGKSEIGNLTLSLKRVGVNVEINIEDDGVGINYEKVLNKAHAMGLIRDKNNYSKEMALKLILLPGFTTRDQVSQVSGRGVGMDVVSTTIKQLGGRLDIESKPNIGSKFTIKLPFTSSLNMGLFFKVSNFVYAIQLNNIKAVTRVTRDTLNSYLSAGRVNFVYLEKIHKVVHLCELLGMEQSVLDLHNKKSLPLIVLQTGEFDFAVLVDEVIGSREILVKSLGRQYDHLPICSGATIMADGDVVIILDVLDLSEKYNLVVEQIIERNIAKKQINACKLIMIVDDSMTVRKVTTGLLGRNNYSVISAKDGIDALHLLKHHRPDLILLDIEMPRMDGFELVDILHEDKNLFNIPIIMITSRTGEKHRKRAKQLGIQYFLGKPYENKHLLQLIKEIIKE